MRTCPIALVACCLLPSAAPAAEPVKRPNILWITCEDISPNLGCYGDKDALTPSQSTMRPNSSTRAKTEMEPMYMKK